MVSEGTGRRLNLSLEPVTGPFIFLLLILGSLARGLFFQTDLLQFQIAVVVIFALEWLDRMARGDGTILAGWEDALPLLLGLAYCASLAVAVDKRAGASEALKYLTLFMVYWVVSRLAYTRAWAVRFANLVVFIGVLLSVIGLGAAVGLIDFPGAFVRGEILSTFQYSNALAGFLAAACVIILALWGPRPRPSPRPRAAGQGQRGGEQPQQLDYEVSWLAEAWYAFAFVLCAVVLLSTRSRGSWVLLPVAGAIALWGLPTGQRFQASLRASAGVVATLVILRRIDGIIAAANKAASGAAPATPGVVDKPVAQVAAFRIAAYVGIATLAVLAGVVALRMLAAALRRANTAPETQRVARVVLTTWAIGVTVWYAVYAGSAYPSAARGFFTPHTAAELESIDVGAQGLVARELFWSDAIRIVRDRPLLGAGGGGWNALYHIYQRKLYSSALVHSHPLEVAVETGVPGFLIYTAMWVVMVRNAWALWRRRSVAEAYGELDSDTEAAWAACLPAFSGAVAMGLHSAMDFDFSLAAIAAVAWGLMACVNGVARTAQPRGANGANNATGANGANSAHGPDAAGPVVRTRSLLVQGIVGLAVCAVVFTPTLRLTEASAKGTSAARAMISGDYAAADKLYREAIRLDPFTASYWIDLAQLSLASYTVDAQPWRLEQVRDYCDRAVKVQPSNLAARIRATEILSSMGDLDRALRLAVDTTKWIPRDVRVYEGLARVYVTMAVRALGAGDRAAGREYAGKAREIVPAAAQSINPNPGPKIPEALVQLAETPPMGYAVGQASLFLGDYAEAARMFEKAARLKSIQADAQVWLGVSYEMAGDTARAKRVLNSARTALGANLFDLRYREIRSLAGALR
ncbi:MAG: hypothetical protein HPY55_08540 [Firmicutes bacterium]|nr:hypothetical protein [Bacillota bacterium]